MTLTCDKIFQNGFHVFLLLVQLKNIPNKVKKSLETFQMSIGINI